MTKITRDQLIGDRADSGSSGGSSGGDLGEHLSRVWEKIQEEPQLQKVAYQAAEANGIDLSPVIQMMNDGEQAEAPQDQQAAQTDVSALPAGESPRADGGGSPGEQAALSADDVIGFLRETADVHPKGEQATLGDLIRLGESNPAIIETAIDMRLDRDGEQAIQTDGGQESDPE